MCIICMNKFVHCWVIPYLHILTIKFDTLAVEFITLATEFVLETKILILIEIIAYNKPTAYHQKSYFHHGGLCLKH